MVLGTGTLMAPRCTRLGGTSMPTKGMAKGMCSGSIFHCLRGSGMSPNNLT
uniref:Uncharacterized protein n=1 Tax=Arundo donax TaxID=35708 RepID=A0A0A9EFN3_ARUDO